ncbi:MAG: helix-turn-helix domain-containing protein [Chloroflexaceae bacterium]|nr:helix-turn-helix domain-containing protein [Chloroflexaceae bacterium]
MRGRKKTYTVTFSDTEDQTIRATAASLSQPYRDVQRARALVMCADHPDWSDAQVAAQIGVSDRMVRAWRKRWCETRSIQEAPRSGRPRVFSRCGVCPGH